MHWLLFAVVACLAVAVWMVLNRPDFNKPFIQHLREMVFTAGLMFLCFLALLPYFVFDALKLTNRFAGPMYRLHRTMQAAANGEKVKPIRFRDGDYWQDVADDFNRVVAYYEGRLAEAESKSATQEPVGAGTE